MKLNICVTGSDTECAAAAVAALATLFVICRISEFTPAKGPLGRIWVDARAGWGADPLPADELVTPIDLDALGVPAGGRS